MKPFVVFGLGLAFLLAGFWFYSSASDLSHVGPITFDSGPAALQSNSATAMAVAASSGIKSFIAEKLCLAGEILLGVGALGWIWTPSRLARNSTIN